MHVNNLSYAKIHTYSGEIGYQLNKIQDKELKDRAGRLASSMNQMCEESQKNIVKFENTTVFAGKHIATKKAKKEMALFNRFLKKCNSSKRKFSSNDHQCIEAIKGQLRSFESEINKQKQVSKILKDPKKIMANDKKFSKKMEKAEQKIQNYNRLGKGAIAIAVIGLALFITGTFISGGVALPLALVGAGLMIGTMSYLMFANPFEKIKKVEGEKNYLIKQQIAIYGDRDWKFTPKSKQKY